MNTGHVSIPDVQDLNGVKLINTKHNNFDGTVGVFIIMHADNTYSLVETGPGSTLNTVKTALHKQGLELRALRSILLTHIHLDHAGAAGALARASGASVYVHEKGAPHMMNPERLMSSASRIYGDAMERLWGDMLGVPEAQIKALQGGETITLNTDTIHVTYTPGHASHHVAYLLNNSSLFTGDAAAIRLTGSSVVRPALPPPEVNLEVWEDSVKRMRALGAERLLLTHFGEVTNADEHLALVPERNREWANVILKGMQAHESPEQLVARISAYGDGELLAEGAPPEVVARHRTTSNYEMTVSGVTRYWSKHHPELLPES